MIPYLYDERTNRVYEITANHKIKREYEKEYQRKIQQETFKALEPSEYKALMDKENLNADKELELSIKLMQKFDINEFTKNIQRDYIIKMIVSKYNDVTRENVEELLSHLEEEYGEQQVEERIGKIFEKVFTQVGVAQEKAMPMWGMEE